jgi:hypothetical protein
MRRRWCGVECLRTVAQLTWHCHDNVGAKTCEDENAVCPHAVAQETGTGPHGGPLCSCQASFGTQAGAPASLNGSQGTAGDALRRWRTVARLISWSTSHAYSCRALPQTVAQTPFLSLLAVRGGEWWRTVLALHDSKPQIGGGGARFNGGLRTHKAKLETANRHRA